MTAVYPSYACRVSMLVNFAVSVIFCLHARGEWLGNLGWLGRGNRAAGDGTGEQRGNG